MLIAIVLTACGIETREINHASLTRISSDCNSTYRLRYWNKIKNNIRESVRLNCNSTYRLRYWNLKSFNSIPFWIPFIAIVLTACGIETERNLLKSMLFNCNSTYRLRYWNAICLSLVKRRLYYCNSTYRLRYWNLQPLLQLHGYRNRIAIVLTACGIETTNTFR